MTDRELLEAAAKAAGLWTDGWHRDGGLAVRRPGQAEGFWSNWNPLADDGDALRLAVEVLNWPHGGRAFVSQVAAMYAVGRLPRDPYAATRRAIVSAAAEMDPQGK